MITIHKLLCNKVMQQYIDSHGTWRESVFGQFYNFKYFSLCVFKTCILKPVHIATHQYMCQDVSLLNELIKCNHFVDVKSSHVCVNPHVK